MRSPRLRTARSSRRAAASRWPRSSRCKPPPRPRWVARPAVAVACCGSTSRPRFLPLPVGAEPRPQGAALSHASLDVVGQPMLHEIDDLPVPPDPVVRDVVAPDVDPGRDALVAQDLVELPRLADHAL